MRRQSFRRHPQRKRAGTPPVRSMPALRLDIRRTYRQPVRTPVDRNAIALGVVLGFRSDHQRIADLVLALADGGLELRHQLRVLLKVGLRILAALTDADAVVAEPGA